MISAKVLMIFIAMGLIAAAVVSAQPKTDFPDKAAGNGNGRFIAHGEKELSDAVAQGCNVVRNAKTLTAVVCPESVAFSLGLQKDIRVFAMDTGANAQINADDVQALGNTGAGRIVAVLDTGVDYNHVQLADSILLGRDFVDDDNDPLDLNGHGTHVAGIITANSGQSKGVAPDAKVLAVRVLDAGGSGYFSDIVAAIYYVVDGPDGINGTADDFNADAISMSLGTAPPYTYKGFCDSVLPSMTNAIKYARDHNTLVVVAAGNSGSAGVSIPGCISYSTTIGAVDKFDTIASFSGRGKAVDITAPGVSIYSTWLNGGYAIASGTSMSTPMVSGVAALVRAAHPTYTDDKVQDALLKTAKDLGKLGYDTSYGWGRVDALKAVAY